LGSYEKNKSNSILKKPLTPAMEDYMEAIFNLDNEKRVVRVKDIAKTLGVKMPTVTNMLKTLSKRDLIDYEKYEYIELTKKGNRIGKEISRRHHVLRNFLVDILKVDPKKADKEACEMEHAVSPSTLDRFVEFMEFLQFCPRTGSGWLENFDEYRRHGGNPEKCADMMKDFSNIFKEAIEIKRDEREGDGTQRS
jgi:DtxR family Mn-dependent transcriptional regulator